MVLHSPGQGYPPALCPAGLNPGLQKLTIQISANEHELTHSRLRTPRAEAFPFELHVDPLEDELLRVSLQAENPLHPEEIFSSCLQ